MKLKTWQKTVLSAIIIAAGGFILFNTAFLLAAGIINGLNWLIKLIAGSEDVAVNMQFGAILFVLLILIASWFIFKSKLPTLGKAVYLTMPLMVVLIYQAILLSEMPSWIPVTTGAVIVGLIVLYLYKKKLSWMYYFAALFTGAVALAIALLGIEI